MVGFLVGGLGEVGGVGVGFLDVGFGLGGGGGGGWVQDRVRVLT